MPLYEFRCDECGLFDAWRSIAERQNPADCPSCEKPAQRIFSPPTAILSSSLRVKKENPEPQLLKKDREPKPSTLKNKTCGRPWMISH
jgi:putative FmdB family regulatory protein